MSEIKHTPGPWSILNRDTGCVGVDAPFFMVASVYGDHEECQPDDRMIANANLVAAEPALLEALKEAVEVIQNICCSDNSCEPMMDLNDFESVIAKATGETA